MAIGTSVVAAAVATHGLVFSAMYLDGSLPVSTYHGFFQYFLLGVERLWSYGHGWEPMSHIRDFGWFYAPVVQFLCPVIGFALFWLLSRHKVGPRIWKPTAIAVLLAVPSAYIGLVPGSALPWVEMARTLVVLLLMVYSVGALHIPRPRFPKRSESAWGLRSRACI